MVRHSLAALVAFAIAGPAAAGSAVLTWTPPTQNTDGSTLTDLAGYRVAWGCVGSGNYPFERYLLQPNLRSFLVEGLPDTGTCYFRVYALNAGRVPTATAPSWTSESSPPSNEAQKTMNAAPPATPYTRSVSVAPAGTAAPFTMLPPARIRLGFAGDPVTVTRDATSSPTRAELRAEFVQSGELVVVPFTTPTLAWTPPFAGLWRLSTRSCNTTGCGDWRDAIEDGALFFFRLKAPTGGGIDP